ncbi:kinase-like protein [Rhypophila sp. PSN 637]
MSPSLSPPCPFGTGGGGIFRDDNAYFGSLDIPRRDLKLEQIALALTPVPDEHLFPDITLYDVFQKHNVLNLIPKDLLEEAKVMQMLSQHSHPHIICYHGCYVRRGRIISLVLDRHSQELVELLRNKVGTVDKGPFMRALESAIRHLHSLNWAHNDLHPGNILIDQAGMPVLIDFGSAREIGTKLGTSRGTKGWIEGEMKDYHTSDSGHDLFALEMIRLWLDSPTFDNF